MEIEVPRRLVSAGLWLVLVAAPLLVGWHVSLMAESGLPLLLTPRLRELQAFRQEMQGWMRVFQAADSGLGSLLDEPQGELFDQNEQVNRLYQRMRLAAESIDQTPAPPTFDPLHELLAQTASAYLDTATCIARWISEPSAENLQLAREALESARALLERLYANPWTEA